MTGSLGNLTRLTPSLVKKASLTGARAFADDPTTIYLIPDRKKRSNLHYAFEYYLRLAILDRDEAYATSIRCEGVVAWVHSGARSSFINTLRASWPGLPLHCGWQYLLRNAILERHYERLRQELAPKPHMYLALLAVDPEFQGRGFAHGLITPMLRRLDADKLPAYVETQNLKNVAMYERWGFGLIKEDRMRSAIFSMYLMIREPRTS